MLPINLEKFAILPLGRTFPSFPYTLAGAVIPVTQVEKDLGILVCTNLKSAEDTNRKVAGASRILGAIRRAFSKLSPEIFRVLYSSHVRPILEYGQPATYPLTQREVILLERVQRRGTRWITGLRTVPYEERPRRLNLFHLDCRRRRVDLTYTRCILNGELGEELRGFFTLHTSGPTRGHQLKLYKPRRLRFKTTCSLSTRVINDWNALPSTVLETQSEDGFKKSVDEHLGCGADRRVS